MTGLRLLLLILSIVCFIICAILGLITSVSITINQLVGVVSIGLALFASSFLPIP